MIIVVQNDLLVRSVLQGVARSYGLFGKGLRVLI